MQIVPLLLVITVVQVAVEIILLVLVVLVYLVKEILEQMDLQHMPELVVEQEVLERLEPVVLEGQDYGIILLVSILLMLVVVEQEQDWEAELVAVAEQVALLVDMAVTAVMEDSPAEAEVVEVEATLMSAVAMEGSVAMVK